MANSSKSTLLQTLVGVGVLGIGAGLALGAVAIRGGVGYSGIGPNFLAWLVAAALGVCGVLLVREARSGGFRHMEEPSGAPRGDLKAIAWVSAGILANAALVTTIGFVLSCALCFVLAVRGLRSSEGRPAGGARQTLIDALTGIAIAAPTYWMFTKLLGLNLPGATTTGWI